MELLPSLLSTLKAVDPQAVKEEYSVSLSLKKTANYCPDDALNLRLVSTRSICTNNLKS